MAGIGTAVTELLAKLATSSISYVRVWNNQFRWIEEQSIEAFSFPCAFLEVILPNNYTQLGLGWTESDVTFRVHIGVNELDSSTGTMEQNLNIFTLRDEVIALMSNYKLADGGSLMKVSEQQDYQHSNVYVYTIDFVCGFIDDTGSQLKNDTQSTPPTTLTQNYTI
jgi:hypothetical protein